MVELAILIVSTIIVLWACVAGAALIGALVYGILSVIWTLVIGAVGLVLMPIYMGLGMLVYGTKKKKKLYQGYINGMRDVLGIE